MKPIVGVTPLWDDEKESLWMLPGYLEGIRQAGGLPVIFPLTTDEEDPIRLAGLCDGFLFTGGHDVSPEVYGEEPLEGLISDCPKRDALEEIVLREALREDKPVLGICRGIQFINAALGGTLYQDLPTQHPSAIVHRQTAPYDEPTHTVAVMKGSPLHACLQLDELPVNSYHHQAVRELAPGLEAMAVAPDGRIEAFHMPGRRFLWAVQWHPEFAYRTDENAQKIFRAFVEAC